MNATQTYETKQVEQKPKRKAGMIATAVLGIGISLASLVGCQGMYKNMSIDRQVEKANGYDVVIMYYNKEHKGADIRIGNYQDEQGFDYVLYARDRDGDGRVEEIHINAPKGSPLEKLACAEKIDEIYTSLKK